ncbi:MAG: acyltransferase [Candidatus Cloacimonetes bacterium]|nr:acyltransferase [Candidatus Cloacimonadota bacterium]
MKAINELSIRELAKFVFFSFWQTIFNLLLFSPLRVCFLRIFGAKIGKDVVVDKIDFTNLHKKGLRGLKVGSECFVGRGVFFDLTQSIVLEDKVTLAPGVMILTHLNVGYQNHPLIKYFPKSSSEVVIKKGTFVGARSIILAGATIGEESFIGAGALVAKQIPSRVLAAGIPAQIIREIK